MSSALAIAGVTAVLRDKLNDGVVNGNVSGILGTTVTVSALPPDQVVSASGSETSQLNLFLHKVTLNTGWCNEGLPSRDTAGQTRLSNPPLALNLHYLLSAYSGGDLHGDILLGYAMQLMHETPVLTRTAIRTALVPSPDVGLDLPPALRALADSGLDQQIEQIRITPEYLNTEELSKLWTAMQSRYRPSAAYQVSVVLIQATQPARSPLPVLSRGKVDAVTHREAGIKVQPDLLPPYPYIESIAPDTAQIAAEMGDRLIVSGHNLDGSAGQYRLLLSNAKLGVERELGPEADPASALSVPFDLNDPNNIPAGTYAATLKLLKVGELQARTTNAAALVVAPKITGGLASPIHLDAAGNLTLTPTCTPPVRPEQRVSLILGGYEVVADSFTTATTTPSFTFAKLPVGEYWVRLRVDGIDSLLVKRTVGEVPSFIGPRIEVQA
ncbi:MAG: hypothetical protein JWQ90_2995 [Hydrocarboniphaga sp.]|uniref:DUF4255 domain-containing protein n=1 Tax=Hydrocarboniphaga sp. TaxID=2033016 RepID=UPI0026325B10|nr:DUF4255 domain-containing protein [Hydrocarboniphaga sp.]MDB5970545.1 hypothetical protein [Hydrocarboniphaga sp.]